MKFKKPTLNWVLEKSKPLIPAMLVICIIGMISSLCAVWIALQSKTVIDNAVLGIRSDFIKSIILLVIIILMQFLLNGIYMKISSDTVAKYSLRLQREVFNDVIHMKYKDIISYHTGELMNRISSDAETVMCGILGIIPNVFTFAAGIIAAFIALYIIEPYFAIMCVILGLSVAAGVLLFGKKLKHYSKECRKRSDECNSFMMECIQNILPIKSFLNEEKIVENSAEIQKRAYISLKKRNNANIVARLSASFVFSMGYYIALGWGAFKIMNDTAFSYGKLIAMLQLVVQIQSPFKDISSIIPQYYSMLASADRIIEISSKEKDIEDTKEDIRDFEKIKFEGITFGYNDELVFENADFEIDKNNFYTLVGISGIGKSTLLKLLLGIYTPDEGKISIVYSDGSEEILSAKHRKLFSYVPQGNMILSGTIRKNVVFFNKTDDEQKVIKCLKLAGLWDDVCEMTNGINTKIGENGTGISEGQAQRVAIARALYYNAPIILFDEATSALDNETEKNVLYNIRKLNNKTCILVSHKPAAEEITDLKVEIESRKIKWKK